MNLLQKLNLEPGAPTTRWSEIRIMVELTDSDTHRFMQIRDSLDAEMLYKKPITHAEFLAACEEWLKKN